MTEVSRICPQCGNHFALEARHCSHCGYDVEAALPTPPSMLPALVVKAAAPLLVGAASLAASLGWRLLQSLLTRPVKATAPPIQVRSDAPVRPQSRMTIRITTSWVVGDAGGNWRKGRSEQTIEIE
ncbi:MAG: zinc ribbon domain-containing protein [Caldilinea sp.]|nr:zinc ribbon domain-containing protein [Caldilinea sp.]MDW8440170.1 hypothetical protein [Caldilineaceae bacterium]